jgi:UDP-N-acetyl-D-glucosamine dehydrogenase
MTDTRSHDTNGRGTRRFGSHGFARMEEFTARIRTRDLVMGVIGLGYTGLPLAVAAAQAGFTTFGYDHDAELCAQINRGISHIGDVTKQDLQAMRAADLLTAVAAPDLSPVPDVVFICVPTPFTKMPDLSYVRSAARSVARVLRPGMVIIAQSTSYPGTTTEIIQPLLEESGLRAGHDFALAFSPERIDPGSAGWNIHNTPRIIGGVTQESTGLAAAALGAVLGDRALVVTVGGPEVAEFAKLLENSYRLVNIGLVNEMAMLAHEMGIDIREVIAAAATKPYGFQAFYPGVGPGGACIPEDPLYLTWKARSLEFDARLIDLAVQENQGMARYVFVRVMEMMSRRGRALGGSHVLCVGAGYKPDVADIRHSRSLRVMELLADSGAKVDYTDPLIPTVQVDGREYKSIDVASTDPAEVDVIVVLVAGRDLDLSRFTDAGVLVFDAAHALAAGEQVEYLLGRQRARVSAAQQCLQHRPEPVQVTVDADDLVPAGSARDQLDLGPPDPERLSHGAHRRLGRLTLHRPRGHPDHQCLAADPPDGGLRRPRLDPDGHRECHRVSAPSHPEHGEQDEDDRDGGKEPVADDHGDREIPFGREVEFRRYAPRALSRRRERTVHRDPPGEHGQPQRDDDQQDTQRGPGQHLGVGQQVDDPDPQAGESEQNMPEDDRARQAAARGPLVRHIVLDEPDGEQVEPDEGGDEPTDQRGEAHVLSFRVSGVGPDSSQFHEPVPAEVHPGSGNEIRLWTSFQTQAPSSARGWAPSTAVSHWRAYAGSRPPGVMTTLVTRQYRMSRRNALIVAGSGIGGSLSE